MKLLLNVPGRSRRFGRGALAAGALDEYAGQVLASADDAHEITSGTATGTVVLDDTILRLGQEQSDPIVRETTLAGARFTGVTLEQGAVVSFAQLRFVAAAGNGKGCVLRIRAEASDNAPTFTTTATNLSDRALSTAYVDWDVPVWESGFDNADTLSPNVATVVQEIVNRVGWTSGSAIAFLISISPANTDAEAPRRRARSFDGSAASAPRVGINTTEGGGGTEPPPGSFSDGSDLFGVEGNEAYNPASPTLKDGTAITGQMADDLAGYAYWRENQATAYSLTRFATQMALTNNQYLARHGQPIQDTVSRMFRLTGDLRDLDFLCAGFDELQANLDNGPGGGPRIAWESPWTVAGVVESACGGAAGDPWSPYRKLNGTDSSVSGTDAIRLNVLKMFGMIAEFTWMLHINQAKASPDGVNYGTRLAYWKTRLEEHVKAWSETSAACWAVNNYKGVDGDSGLSGVPNISSSRKRQTWGLYPYATRDEGHAIWNTITLHRYIGLLGNHASLDIPNPADALTAAAAMVTAIRENGSFKVCSNADHGASLPMTWTNPLRGNTSVPMRVTYTGYVSGSLVQLWMTGAYRDVWTQADMLKVGSALSWAHDGTTGLTHGNITRGVAECGFDAAVRSGESAATNSYRGFAVAPVVFDPGGTKMGDIAASLIALGGGTTPDRAPIHSARFARAALLAVEDLD